MSFLLFPDFDEEYPVWPKVIREYITKFSADDDVSLMIRIKPDELFHERLDKVADVVNEKQGVAHILLINDELPDDKYLIKEADYLITTRSFDTIEYLDYAYCCNTKIRYGVDIPVFY